MQDWKSFIRKYGAGIALGVLVAGGLWRMDFGEVSVSNQKTEQEEVTVVIDSGHGEITNRPKKAKNNSKKKNYYKKKWKNKKAFSVVDTSKASKKQIKALFYASKITKPVFRRMRGKSYKKNCTVPRRDLRYIRVLHVGFDQKVHIGELVANRLIASDLCKIFYQLYCNQYQIEKMVLVDQYGADDLKSMADNNTSCFNYRPVSGTARLSNHSYGLAIDINPRYNPYLYKRNGKKVCEPSNGKPYRNRKASFQHKISHTDLCFRLFQKRGFTWGGDWNSSKDYQHFQKTK